MGKDMEPKIKFSRHARRRARLYRISESTIRDIVGNAVQKPGRQKIIAEIEGMKFPLKIVVQVEIDRVTVVSNYPLKKGKKP